MATKTFYVPPTRLAVESGALPQTPLLREAQDRRLGKPLWTPPMDFLKRPRSGFHSAACFLIVGAMRAILWPTIALPPLALLLFAGCQPQDEGPLPTPLPPEATSTAAPQPSPPPLTPVRTLALGDSYTIGQGVDSSARWPSQLHARLQDEGYRVAEPEVIARTGWTTSDLLETVGLAKPQGPYEIVTLMIGVNNQFQGREVEEYRREFVELLDLSISLAGGRASNVIVLSIPDWGDTPFAAGRDRAEIAKEIDVFNSVNLEEAAKADVRYVAVTPISRRTHTDQSLVAPDGLHPSEKMYAEWVELLLPETRAILDGPR